MGVPCPEYSGPLLELVNACDVLAAALNRFHVESLFSARLDADHYFGRSRVVEYIQVRDEVFGFASGECRGGSYWPIEERAGRAHDDLRLGWAEQRRMRVRLALAPDAHPAILTAADAAVDWLKRVISTDLTRRVDRLDSFDALLSEDAGRRAKACDELEALHAGLDDLLRAYRAEIRPGLLAVFELEDPAAAGVLRDRQPALLWPGFWGRQDHDLHEVPNQVLQSWLTVAPSAPDPAKRAAGACPQYVDLDQIAAIVNQSKDTLSRKKNASGSTMPPPDIEGGGGKKDYWDWLTIRPWLVHEYPGRQIPDRFPDFRTLTGS